MTYLAPMSFAEHSGTHVDAPSHSLPAAGAVAVIGVVPSENGTGSPCRVIAAW
jgi:kynurenine formamidase